MLGFLTDNLALVTLLALTIIVLLVLVLVVWAAVQGSGQAERNSGAGRQPDRQMSLDSLKQSFRRAVELIEANLATRSERYNLSWALVINEDESGQELPLLASGIPSALSTDSALSAQALGISWNFFDQGVAIQLQGGFLGDPDNASAPGNKVWDEFLGLCRNYRPDRPFDTLVLALPARLLLPASPEDELGLVARARVIHRRLWLAQNRFALQFPVSLVVTGCEFIPGFAAFAAALPEAMRRSMLGWSSHHELGAPFQGQWVELGMDEVTRDVQDACAELCALELPGQDSADYFMLPTEIERLRRGLRVFAEELMRPSAYHEPFILRGFYLTGDCGPAAALAAASAAGPRKEASGASLEDMGSALAPPDDGALTADPDFALPVVPEQSRPRPDSLEREPAFLRDVFEKKVFAESGLVRASSVQRLRRPALGRALGWTAAVVPAVWLIGLGLSTLRLHELGTEIEAALLQLDRDSRTAVTTEPADAARLRARAVATLELMERTDAGLFASIFMPGSRPAVDDVHRRLAARLERGFTENSVEPLRLGAYARISELTGVPTDPSTGTLIAGAACTLPAGFEAEVRTGGRGGLNVEDLPEFSAVLHFVNRIEELDKATRALDRLTGGEAAPSGEDLKRVVQTFLGAELAGNYNRAAQLFRHQARNSAALAIGQMRQATVCSFNAAMRVLQERLFDGNELLSAEQTLQAQVQAQVGKGADWAAAQQGWMSVLDAIREQEDLMQPGKGAWMHRRTLALGQPWETLMQRMQASVLIGPEAGAAMQKQLEDDFSRFLGTWDAVLTEGAGLAWAAKESRWALTQERVDLRDGLTAVLALPSMKPGRRKLPDIPQSASVGWDRFKLDQALALAEGRKKFEADLLPRLPADVREDVDAMVRAALADGIVDLLAQSVMVSARGGQAPAVGEAERTRVLRARMLLGEIDARAAGDRLGQLLTRDALARLRTLDDSLRQSDIYQPREPDFRSWDGDKGPLLGAFAAGDQSGLAAYAAQQQVFVEGLAKEAEVLLQAFEGSNSADPVVTRWRGIVADLARYRLKSPASSLAMLEQFVITGAADLDMNNCSDKLKVSPRRIGDFFSERLVSLQASLSSRCRDLRSGEIRESWTRMAEAFNRELAGRAPFRAAGGSERPPADADEAVAVLRSYERVTRLMGNTPVSPAVRRFDEQMERVRAFMAPLAPVEEGVAAGYDVAVEFRANPGAELEGNKIIDWTLSIGSQVQRWRDPSKSLRWEPGLPVVLTLRVARDGPVAPKADPTQPAMAIEDRTVTFTFRDPWALYSLVAMQREADIPGRADARWQLLRFDFPLVATSSDGKTLPTETKARVFIRLSISPPGKRASLAWPGIFPTRAPEWAAP
jgi:type VI secretion system protein ImpL